MPLKVQKSRLERVRDRTWKNVRRILREAAEKGEVPIAWAIGMQGDYSWVVQCPYCNRKHIHAKHEGLRQSHCQSLCGQGVQVSYLIKVKPGITLQAIIPEPKDTDYWAQKYINDLKAFFNR